MLKTRAKISDVFTPRRAEVNPDMYVPRPIHEKALRRSVEGSLHTIIAGESGNGKSWLYKKAAIDNDWRLYCGNFGNAARLGSVSAEIFNAIVPKGTREWIEHEETIDAEVNALVAKGGGSSTRKYSIKQAELLEAAFSYASAHASGKRPVVVLDNLEAIFKKSDIMNELGNIILLLDDERYARHGVKIVIVGVPSNIVDYYQKAENFEPIGNRLEEIPFVHSLSDLQVAELVRRGFRDQLQLHISDFYTRSWSKHIHFATLGIAQRVHEYCVGLAFLIEDHGWKVPDNIIQKANWEFVKRSLYQTYAVVEKCMNDRGTKTGRRNQVLYALGQIAETTFDASLVEEKVRANFPKSTTGISLAIGQILADLAKEGRPLIRKTTKGNAYRFRDPKHLMCLRLILVKDEENETVFRKPLKR